MMLTSFGLNIRHGKTGFRGPFPGRRRDQSEIIWCALEFGFKVSNLCSNGDQSRRLDCRRDWRWHWNRWTRGILGEAILLPRNAKRPTPTAKLFRKARHHRAWRPCSRNVVLGRHQIFVSAFSTGKKGGL